MRFVPYAQAQRYLEEKYGLRPVTQHTQRKWIKAGKFPAPIERSASNKSYTTQQLDSYAQQLLEQSP